MKQKLNLLLICICLLTVCQIKAQLQYSPDAADSTRINFCSASPEMAIRTNSNTALLRSLPPVIPPGSFIICGSGKFRIIFNDIINATGAGFDDATLGATRRNCVCDVINYIESVISIPNNIGTTDPTIDIIFNNSTNIASNNLASAAPVYPSSFYLATPNPTPGYYGGYLYDYITTGIKPDINSEEAQVTVNFGQNYTYCTPTIGDCEYDFFSVILHELTHGLGFLSFAIDNSGTLSSRFANNVFSKLDQHYLYYNNGASFNKMFDITAYSANNGVNPALPLNAAITNRVWLTNTALANKQNQPINSQNPYGAGSSLSHFDSWFPRACISPGYSSNYLMDSYISTHQFKRTFTIQEVKVLQTMGYTINPSYPNIANINNNTPYHTGTILTAIGGGPGSYMNSTPASGLSDLTISTTNGNNVTLNLTTGIVSNGSISHSLNFIDPNGNPITVYEPKPGWKGLYNIRGCGNGGNNTNQLSINATRDLITFTPRNNFIGRAQFAFHLSDGIQRGDYVVFTIDVAKGSSFVNTPANELLINGNFEEGTEMRAVGGNEFNLVADEISTSYNYNDAKPFSDGVQYVNWGWNDPYTRNVSNACLFPAAYCFDNCAGSGGIGPLPPSNVGDRYNEFFVFPGGGEPINMTLAESILPCNYTLEADVNLGALFSNVTANSTFNFLFHNQGLNNNVTIGGATTLLNVSTPITLANINTWTHVTIPFTYTSSIGSSFVQIDGNNLSGFMHFDNLSIKRTGSVPTLSFTPSSPTICAGQTANILVAGATSYTWSTGANTNSITVSPSVTTTYSVIGTSGCGTNTAQITVTVNPTPTITVNSFTICAETPTTITASGATTYTWSTGDNGNSTVVTPSISTQYSVIGANLAGCTSTQTVIVWATSLPTGALTPNGSISLCGSQTITLNATSVQDPNTSYSWTYNGSPAGTGNNINVSTAGQYVVTITNTITGCIKTYTTPVYVAPNYVCDQCLVPNGDFEYAANLSNNMSNITDAPFWNSPSSNGSPDYYNTGMTAMSGVSIPNNIFASNTPDHTGNVNQAYAGLINYATNVSEAREYIQTPLNCPLEPNQRYNVSMWARAANGNRHISNNVGIHLSNTSITGATNLYAFTPQFNFTSLIPATAWTQLTGTITGSSANFITIGNFYNDAATTFSVINAPSIFQNAYYFIDDVSVTPAPPSFTASASSCVTSGSAVTLTLSGSPAYAVTNGVTTQTLNAPSGTIAVTPTVTTTYTITPILNCVKCNIFSVLTVSVNPVITANNATICAGTSTVLTASGATTYSWNTGATTNTVSVSPSSATVYTVTGTAFGCSNTKTVSVTVTPNPTVSVSNRTICAGTSTVLTASGATTYSWNTGATTNTISVSPTANTIYTVTGTTNICTNTKTVSVTVTPNPTVSVSNRTICAGTSTVLTASGATTYSWSTGATTNTISVSPTTNTIYTVTGTTNGCTNTKTVSVTVTPNPTVAVNNATICAGTSTVLTASGATTYSWNTGATTNTISVSPTANTIYTVTGTSNGCTNTKTVSVTVNSTPTVAVNNVTICPTASTTLTASGATTYSWTTGATTTTIVVTPTATTVYTVIGTNTVGCTNTKTVSVTITPTITATSNQSVICAGQSSTLTASSANTYSWSTGATTSSIVVTPSVTTIYTVTGTTTNSCVSTKTLQVLVTGQYCCQTASFSVGASTATNTNYSNTSNGGGSVIDVLGTITFTANSTLTNYKIRMAPTASININTGVTVTFSNCTVFSCTDLWGGVFIKDGVGVPGIVNVIGSRFEDMYMGIVHAGQNGSATGSTNFINVSNSIFNNNYISIQLRNYPRAHATALRQGLSVTGSTITSQYSTTSPQNTLKSSSTYTYAYNNINSVNNPYVNFPRGIAGIYLYNLEEIPVILGDSTGAAGTNRLENLDFGVYAENASIKAFNNHFINLTGSAKQHQSIGFPPPPPPAGPAEIGIGISAIITNGSVYWVRVGKVAGTTTPTGGNPFPAGNKFEDCGKGIAITNYEDPFVKGNVFTATTTSVPPMLTPSSLYSYYKAQSGVYIKEIKLNATITNNYILNHSSGVYTSHNIYASYVATPFVKVENNFVEAPGTNGYCRQAIQVDQVLSSTNLGAGLLTVKNNTIQNVYNGIKAFNVKGGLQINSNPTINLSASKMLGVPGLSPTQINNYARTGIYVQTCQDAVVANNPNITSNGTINSTYYTAVKGIWFNASTGTTGQVNCNVISNMGRCMQFSGTSLNKISKNVMNGTYQGFVLSLNGVIGNQGHLTNTTHDNEWNGFTGGAAQYAETYTESSGNNANTNSKFYVKSGSPYQPTQNYSTTTPYQTGLSLGIDIQSGLPSENCLALRVMQGDNSNTNNGNNAMRITSDGDSTNTDVFEALASDTTFYEVYQNETQYRNQQLVYELINTQSIDTTQTLGEFYDDNQKTNYQTIISINDALANADYQTAQTINSSLTANNLIEEYQKRVNELLVKYINYQSQPVDSNATPFTNKAPVFDGTELADLSTIANSCFDKYGSVITQARVLMNNVSNTLIEFEDNCQPEFNQRKKQINNSVASNVNVKLYPNPNNGLMSLEYDLGNSQHANINLYDITGKLISSYKLDSNKGILQLNEQNLNNGIYFYHILVGEKTIKTDKIVIIK